MREAVREIAVRRLMRLRYIGHANISVTLDRYGHLMPGNEAEAATLLDTYLDGARSTG